MTIVTTLSASFCGTLTVNSGGVGFTKKRAEGLSGESAKLSRASDLPSHELCLSHHELYRRASRASCRQQWCERAPRWTAVLVPYEISVLLGHAVGAGEPDFHFFVARPAQARRRRINVCWRWLQHFDRKADGRSPQNQPRGGLWYRGGRVRARGRTRAARAHQEPLLRGCSLAWCACRLRAAGQL